MKMIGNKFLLDTNIITAWLKGEISVADKIDKAKKIHIPHYCSGGIILWCFVLNTN
jgi:poly(3-hydroxyalkanoate) synthetase